MKLEPGNASYELALASSAIPDYLAGLARAHGAEGNERALIEAAWRLIAAHEGRIAEQLLAWLRARSDVRIIGRERGDDPERASIIAFRVDGRDSGEIARALDDDHLAVRFGDFHARRLVEHLGLLEGGGVVRVSMAHYNTHAEVDRLIAGFERVLG